MKANDMLNALIFGGDVPSTINDMSTSGGESDSGKVLAVNSSGKITPVNLTVGEGAVAVDSTLAVTGAAADAKKTGDEIATLNESLDSIEPRVDDMMQVKDVYSGNVVDLRGKTAPASTLDGTIHFSLDDGTYYSNPFAVSTAKSWYTYPRKANGTVVKGSTDGGQTYSNFYLDFNPAYIIKIVVDGLNLLCRTYKSFEDALSNEYIHNLSYILEEKPAYWDVRASGYTAGDAVTNLGLTKGHYSQTYVTYTEPTKVNTYTEGFDNHVTDILNTEYDIFINSYNLVDYSKIIWAAKNNFFQTVEGYYIPVSAGDVLVSNVTVVKYWFYNSSKTQISSSSSNGEYQTITAPENTAYMRVGFRENDVSEGDEIMIWKAASAISGPYERPIYRPHKKIAGKYLDSDIYDYAIPDSLSQGIMKMVRFAAIRADNEKHDAYRFATFNIKSNASTSGFVNYGDTLFDFAVDFCGLQEINYTGQEFHAACRPFQFGYYAGDYVAEEGYTTILDNACVSRFEITETYNIRLFDSENGTSVYKILMPWHKHYPRRATLSVYNFHGRLQIADRLREVDAIIDAIAEDTSDFIIVMGDTNSEVDTAGHRQSWDKLIAAGLTPAHNGESPTWPTEENPNRYSSMDNFFFSSHISLMNYGISDWHKYHTTDHDLVWADLIFDFDAVLKDTWEEPATVSAPTT